jgi:cytidine deaminase
MAPARPRAAARRLASTAPAAVAATDKAAAAAASAAAAAAATAAPPLPGFRIDAADVQRMLKERGVTMDTLLLSLLEPAARLARPPVSNYHVG